MLIKWCVYDRASWECQTVTPLRGCLVARGTKDWKSMESLRKLNIQTARKRDTDSHSKTMDLLQGHSMSLHQSLYILYVVIVNQVIYMFIKILEIWQQVDEYLLHAGIKHTFRKKRIKLLSGRIENDTYITVLGLEYAAYLVQHMIHSLTQYYQGFCLQLCKGNYHV